MAIALRGSGEAAGMTETEGRKRPKYLRLGALGDRAEVVRASPDGDGDDAPAFTLTVGELKALLREELGALLGKAAAPLPLLLDREGLAAALGCSSSLIDKLRRQGMPTVRLGESPRFELERCLEWIRKEGAA